MLASIAAVFLSSAAPQPEPVSRYTQLSACARWASGTLGHDWIEHRCAGYQSKAVWIRFLEGTRMQLGFGPKPNFSGIFETKRNDKWPIEWRGRLINGRFVPGAAIIRIRGRFDESGASDLVVYHLLEDGTSCLVPRTISSSAEARAIADAPPSKDDCLIGDQR